MAFISNPYDGYKNYYRNPYTYANGGDEGEPQMTQPSSDELSEDDIREIKGEAKSSKSGKSGKGKKGSKPSVDDMIEAAYRQGMEDAYAQMQQGSEGGNQGDQGGAPPSDNGGGQQMSPEDQAALMQAAQQQQSGGGDQQMPQGMMPPPSNAGSGQPMPPDTGGAPAGGQYGYGGQLVYDYYGNPIGRI
jgi:hypothetical protein